VKHFTLEIPTDGELSRLGGYSPIPPAVRT